ncbi:hypothetical protein ACFO3D_01780 [Virgibacillus kekensis]|uniref:Uncharacterized protein n=1 Tax=Virgibacillus kekensis TaxID=202261 RepID=A0ABV9DDT0_9BACI
MIEELLPLEYLPDVIKAEHIYLLAGAFLSYILIRPLLKWIVSMKSYYLLYYMFVSMVLLVIYLFGTVITGQLNVWMLSVMLQSLSAFGGVLVLYYIIRRLFKNI